MRLIPQSSASSLMVILSRGFVRSSFFKAASSASFVILAIACPPLFYVLLTNMCYRTLHPALQDIRSLMLTSLRLFYCTTIALKWANELFIKKLLLFVKFHGIILLAFRGVAQLG